MKRSAAQPARTLDDVTSLDGYDFVDLGAGDGGSLANLQKTLGGRGLGVELDKRKVQAAHNMERNVVLGNALDLSKLKGKVDAVTCDNFLEHLPTFADVENMLGQAVSVASKFVYIRHPSFEDNEYLASLGLKTYWSDWHGHTSMLKVADIAGMLRKHGVYTCKVMPVSAITDSDDDRIIPLKAPADQHSYKPKYGAKPEPAIVFDHDVYYAFDIIGVLPGAEGSIPQLTYVDRLTLDKRPNFSLKDDEKITRIGELEKQLQILKNRKSMRLADWAGAKIDLIKTYAGTLRRKLTTYRTAQPEE